MPFKSSKQRDYLFAKKPEIANKFMREYGASIKKSAPSMKNKFKRGK